MMLVSVSRQDTGLRILVRGRVVLNMDAPKRVGCRKTEN